MENHWDKMPNEIQEHILIIRLQKHVKKFLNNNKNKKKRRNEYLEYLEMKAVREGIMDPWFDYIDPIYGHLLVN